MPCCAGLGCGFVPEPMARDHIAAGRLVVKQVQRTPARGPPRLRLAHAGRGRAAARPRSRRSGLALRWWLEQLESETTRKALLERHGGRVGDRIR